MTKNKLAAFVAGIALTALAIGCQSTPTNSNANGNTVNGNTAVVTNNNGNTNTAGVSTTNGNSNMMNGNAGANRGNYNANMTREEFDRDKDSFLRQAKDAGRTIGSGANDAWIWTKTRGALTTADDLRDSTINVDVDNGVVTLTGTVSSKAQSDRARTVASSIENVKSVNNKLTVSGGGGGNTNR